MAWFELIFLRFFSSVVPVTNTPHHLLTLGGEFRNPIDEALFRAQRLPEYLRLGRLIFSYAAVTNCLFLFSDWRFYGQPHFVPALVARAAILLASLAGLAGLGHVRTFAALQGTCAAWCLPVIAASAYLVTPHTDIALCIICMLPMVFYLALPMRFAWCLAAGTACSAASLGAHLWSWPSPSSGFGLILALVTVNLVLSLVLSRDNRLQRLEWTATRATKAVNETLSEHQKMLQTLLGAVPAPLLITARDSGRLIEANDAARAYFGPGALQGAFLVRDFIDPAPQGQAPAPPEPADGRITETETRLRLPDGTTRDALLVTTLAAVGGLEAVLTIVVDITRRKELEAHLRRLATTDPLTGLANRARFLDRADDAIRRARRAASPLAVVMCDIDFFKSINDTYGHEAGDDALRAFAGLCRSMVRDQDIVARIGGEEFALLLPDTDRAGALVLGNRLRQAVAGLRLGRCPASMTISVGISELQPEDSSLEDALSRADQALYAAKNAGRNRVVFHDFSRPGPVAPGA